MTVNTKEQIKNEINNYPAWEYSALERQEIKKTNQAEYTRQINKLTKLVMKYKGFDKSDIRYDVEKSEDAFNKALYNTNKRTAYFDNMAFGVAVVKSYETFDKQQAAFLTYFDRIYSQTMGRSLGDRRSQDEKFSGNKNFTRKDREDYAQVKEIARQLFGDEILSTLNYQQLGDIAIETGLSRKRLEYLCYRSDNSVSLNQTMESDDGDGATIEETIADESVDMYIEENRIDNEIRLDNITSMTQRELLLSTKDILPLVAGRKGEFGSILTQQRFDELIDKGFAAYLYKVDEAQINPEYVLTHSLDKVGNKDIAEYCGTSEAAVSQWKTYAERMEIQWFMLTVDIINLVAGSGDIFRASMSQHRFNDFVDKDFAAYIYGVDRDFVDAEFVFSHPMEKIKKKKEFVGKYISSGQKGRRSRAEIEEHYKAVAEEAAAWIDAAGKLKR